MVRFGQEAWPRKSPYFTRAQKVEIIGDIKSEREKTEEGNLQDHLLNAF